MCDFDKYGDCHDVHLRCDQCPNRTQSKNELRDAIQIALGAMNGNLLSASRERNYAKVAEFEGYIKTLEVATDLLPVEPAWKCAARQQSLPEPADCNWPDCGCDPRATKVIENLVEQGWGLLPVAPVVDEAAIRADEREKCAQIAESSRLDTGSVSPFSAVYNTACAAIAQAIRAGGGER